MARARLGMAFEDLRGTMGRQVVTRTSSGLAVKSKPKYRYPVQPATRAGIDRFKVATDVWNTLTFAEVEAWRRFALTIERQDPVTGKRYSPLAKNVFVGLASKLLQLNPTVEVPRVPPAGEFLGDSLLVSVSSEPGSLVFTASAPNSPGVVTELLVQVLPNPRRSPTKDYKSVAFVVFADEPVAIPVATGLYAVGYRFVEAASGRMTEMWTLGVVEA